LVNAAPGPFVDQLIDFTLSEDIISLIPAPNAKAC
jgi:hypothetical protein